MRKAIIDMGTNTFNLLIADISTDSFEIIHATKEPVLLGMGGINDGRLAVEAMARALHTIEYFAYICRQFGVKPTDIRGIGTSAMRAARNANELVRAIQKRFQIQVDIISGEEEANLIYKGVGWSYDFIQPGIIMDIGGGSTEFIFANQSGVQGIVSLETGVSRLYQLLNHPKKYTSQDIQRIYDFMDAAEKGSLKNFTCSTLIGASGGFETLFEMISQEEFNPNIGVVELDFQKVQEQLNWALTSTYEDRHEHPWIIPIRKEMFPIAAAQILWLIEKCSISHVLVSPFSLKEGALR